MTFTTKDSGERAVFESGMVRDTEKGKPRFDLLLPLGVPFAEQMLTRDAQLMARGAEKYEARNWEKARGEAELRRYHSSALRHLLQWIAGETDEDHAAAVRFNIMAGEFVKRHLAPAPTDFDPQRLLEGALGITEALTQVSPIVSLSNGDGDPETSEWDDWETRGDPAKFEWQRADNFERLAAAARGGEALTPVQVERECLCPEGTEHRFECPCSA